jgi:hypothetical protein
MTRNTEPTFEPTAMQSAAMLTRVNRFNELVRQAPGTVVAVLMQLPTPSELANPPKKLKTEAERDIAEATHNLLHHEDDYDCRFDHSTKQAIDTIFNAQSREERRNIDRRRVTTLAVFAGEMAAYQATQPAKKAS